MKKIILVSFLFALGLAVAFPNPVRNTQNEQGNKLPEVDSGSISILTQLDSFTFQNQTYHYAWVKLDNLANLKLLPNHDTQTSSEDLAKNHHCQVLVNGNFYDKQDKPLGWLVSQGQTLSKPLTSSLFNGFFSLSTSKVEISPTVPQEPVDLGLQSGPLLIFDSKPLPLKINNDQPRRRVIVALNNQSQLIFLVITGADSLYSGPLLADTPNLLAALGKTIDQNLVVALNLDGGSASAFHTSELHLNEYAYIGSFFCYN